MLTDNRPIQINLKMGLFSSMFGKNDNTKTAKTVPWIALTSVTQLDEIRVNSSARPQVIFKHSTTCGISRMVLNMFTSSYDLNEGQMDMYFLDLHAHREVSNAVAQKFQVIHQSPQLLLVKNGVVATHDSHGAISEIVLEEYI